LFFAKKIVALVVSGFLLFSGYFRGVLEEVRVLVWYFGGEIVVD
jgi:hypothetical protein